MFWLSLLLTAVLCTPVIKDPLDEIERHKRVGSVESDRDKSDRLFESLKDIITENSFDESVSTLNKSYSIDIGELFNIFETYIIYKETVKSNKETADIDFESNEVGDIESFNDMSDTDLFFSNLFGYIDDHLEEVLNELIVAVRKGAEKDKANQINRTRNDYPSADMFEAKVREIEEQLEVGANVEHSDKISKRASSDTGKYSE